MPERCKTGQLLFDLAVVGGVGLALPLAIGVAVLKYRRFDRARYDAKRVVAQFSVQLREQVDLDVLGGDLLGVVHRVLAPEHLALWLNDPVETATRPAPATDGPGSDQVPEARL